MNKKKQRWIDNVPKAEDRPAKEHAEKALAALHMAIILFDNKYLSGVGRYSGLGRKHRFVKSQDAAKHVVAWRKSLGVKSHRVEYRGPRTGDKMLWCAAQSVSAAAMEVDDATKVAEHLRKSEAALRAHWEENLVPEGKDAAKNIMMGRASS